MVNQGVLLSLTASVLFALVYYLSAVLAPLDGVALFAWRTVLGLPAIGAMVHYAGLWPEVRRVGQKMRSQRAFLGWALLSAFLFGVQAWVFVWAPLNQKAVDVSMGYFLLPLSMVVIGKLLYKERLSPWQWCAVALAVVGVGHELWRTHSFSWATALVAVGYPPYFILRRYLRIGTVVSLWWDFCLMLIPALLLSYFYSTESMFLFAQHARLYWQVPVFGFLAAAALLSYIGASRILPLSLFGLLGYVEPVLLFWVAFLLLDEPISGAQWLTYIPIWGAVGFLALQGGLSWHRERRAQRR